MLTQSQLDKLNSLTQHPKFGKLLLDAIENWKQIKPGRLDYGISSKLLDDGSDIFIGDKFKCCLIGASLIGKTCNWTKRETTHEHCVKYFGISEDEVISLISGFDRSRDRAPSASKEAYEFGYKVSEIIFNHGQNI